MGLRMRQGQASVFVALACLVRSVGGLFRVDGPEDMSICAADGSVVSADAVARRRKSVALGSVLMDSYNFDDLSRTDGYVFH